MPKVRNLFLALMLATAAIAPVSVMNHASAATAEDLDRDCQQALQALET